MGVDPSPLAALQHVERVLDREVLLHFPVHLVAHVGIAGDRVGADDQSRQPVPPQGDRGQRGGRGFCRVGLAAQQQAGRRSR